MKIDILRSEVQKDVKQFSFNDFTVHGQLIYRQATKGSQDYHILFKISAQYVNKNIY